jgi:hypothetical protein
MVVVQVGAGTCSRDTPLGKAGGDTMGVVLSDRLVEVNMPAPGR